jgi:signal peptidase
MGMRTVRFVELVLLVICVLLGTSGSVDVLSDNYIIRDGHTIHQLLASIDSNSMSPDLTLGDMVVLENTSDITIGDIILYQAYGNEDMLILQRTLDYVEEDEPMWEGGPGAPFAGYITKGDHNEVIDQMAGQTLGMANMSYFNERREEITDVGSGIYQDKNTGLLFYQTENGTYVGDGISYLTPVKNEWVVGVVKTRFPLAVIG